LPTNPPPDGDLRQQTAARQDKTARRAERSVNNRVAQLKAEARQLCTVACFQWNWLSILSAQYSA